MKHGPLSKLEERNLMTLKKKTMSSSRQFTPFFGFIDDLEQTGRRIPDG